MVSVMIKSIFELFMIWYYYLIYESHGDIIRNKKLNDQSRSGVQFYDLNKIFILSHICIVNKVTLWSSFDQKNVVNFYLFFVR